MTLTREQQEHLAEHTAIREAAPWTELSVAWLSAELDELREALQAVWDGPNGYGQMFASYDPSRYVLTVIDDGLAHFQYDHSWQEDYDVEVIEMPLSVLYDSSWKEKELDRRAEVERKEEEKKQAEEALKEHNVERFERDALAKLLKKYGVPERGW